MNKNRLKLNDAKTEFVIFGTKQNLQKVNTTSIKSRRYLYYSL